jgi:hypothetical protein
MEDHFPDGRNMIAIRQRQSLCRNSRAACLDDDREAGIQNFLILKRLDRSLRFSPDCYLGNDGRTFCGGVGG